jgi:hypothetical protein
MKKKIIFPFFLLTTLFVNTVFSQTTDIVSVNPNTGTASVVIPIYSINRGGVSFPVSLGYSATGIKIKDGNGTAGLGWQLIAGGQITRELRGMPDDFSKTSTDYQGWLYNSNAALITGFTPSNDNSQSVCTDETTDLAYLHSYFSNHTDTEPDIFHLSAPGLSCDFVFDGSHQIKTIPYRDYKISFTTIADGSISQFVVINDKGVVYTFANVETTLRSTMTNNINGINYFRTDFYRYLYSIRYKSVWHLSSMIDSNGNGVSLGYNEGMAGWEGVPISTGRNISVTTNAPGHLNQKTSLYDILETRNDVQILTSVNSAKDASQISLIWSGGLMEPKIQGITAGGREILFNYSVFTSYYHTTRAYLTSINDRAGSYPFGYKFDYYGITEFGPHLPLYPTAAMLPDTASKQADYWGYYSLNGTNTNLQPALYVNPTTTGYPRYKVEATASAGSAYTYAVPGSAVRTADPTNAKAGTLSKITYANGGSTSFDYELNDYYDGSSNSVVSGGGIRVLNVTDCDSVDLARNIVKSYSYIDPATGLSSGKPTSLPIYGFTRPYVGTGTPSDMWNYSTVTSENDLSTENESILYSYVKVSQANAGRITYEYTNPATLYDTPPADWSPTLNYSARTNCSTTDLTNNNIYSYPFAPNINYDFERGLIKKITNYNQLNQEVSETNYTYQRTGTPIAIPALRIDTNMNSVAYSKYNIYTTSSELVSQVSTKVFDSSTLTQQQSNTVNYYYTSPYHKLVTKQTLTNSDGSIVGSSTTYAKDYPITGTPTDPTLIAIQHLDSLNINVPIEKVHTIQRGVTIKTISAELTKFQAVSGHFGPLYLPGQDLRFVASNGVTDFAPLVTSGGSFTKDLRYIPVKNYLAYDIYGFLQSYDDNNQHVQTVLTDKHIGLPPVMIDNANANEVAFTDFDSNHNGTFFTKTAVPYTLTTDCHTGVNALILNAAENMTATVSNNTALNKYYIFSFWTNSTSGTMTATLSSGGSGTYTQAFGSGTGKWTRYEMHIPMAGVSSAFTLTFHSSTQINIDDVLLYPDRATVQTATYDGATRFKTSETNANGITTYYNTDVYGRINYVLDQDKQIVLKKTYNKKIPPGTVLPYAELDFIAELPPNSQPYAGQTFTYTNRTYLQNPEATDIVYSWNFGDGSATFTGVDATHIYTSVGTYDVVLTTTSAKFGVLTKHLSVTVIAVPTANCHIVYSNQSSGGQITRVKFKQGDLVVYSISGPILSGGTSYVYGDNYTIEVTTAGDTSNFASFTYSGATQFCTANGSASTATYSIMDNLSSTTSVVFKIDTDSCTGVGPAHP